MERIGLTAEQLDWYNSGIVLLMAIMRGRADHGAAERQVYDAWRVAGNLINPGDMLRADVCTTPD